MANVVDKDAVKEIQTMFPNINRSHIVEVLEAHNGDVERTVAYLLEDDGEAPVETEPVAERDGAPGDPAAPHPDADVAAVTQFEKDEELARQLQERFDRDVANALHRDTYRSALQQNSEPTAMNNRGKSVMAEAGQALESVKGTVSGWWRDVASTVSSWAGEDVQPTASHLRNAESASEDPMAGPPRNYMSLDHVDGHQNLGGDTSGRAEGETRWSPRRPAMPTAEMAPRQPPVSSGFPAEESSDKKDR